NQERWLRITNVFDAALDYPSDQRALYVAQACAGDEDLRREVSRLLHELEHAGEFLECPPATTRRAISAGELVAGRYRVEALIGRGGMGEVYRVYDELLDERFALKTLRPELCADLATLRRFQREIRNARKVTHPNVCRVFEVGVYLPDASHNLQRVDFFIMQLLDGETLAARIKRQGPFSRHEAFPLIRQICEGLQAAHDAGIIHRDLKSSNIILCRGNAVITDFGLARAATSGEAPNATGTVTANNLIAGTLAYMSPEQLSGSEITAASDIYSLGVVLF